MLQRQRRRVFFPFLLPAALLYGSFVILPAAQSLRVSFTDWNGILPDMSFVGVQNYLDITHDPAFGNSLVVTLAFIGLGGLLVLPTSLVLAFWTRGEGLGRRLARFVIVAPIALSAVVAAMMWRFIYDPTFGLLNAALNSVGLGAYAIPWLGTPRTALFSSAVAFSWFAIGLYVIFFTSAIARIPREILEAAKVDGASQSQLLRHIILPLIWHVAETLAIFWIITTFQAFVFIYALTGGGPLNSTQVLGIYVYELAFIEHRWGYASAVAAVLVVVSLLLMAVVNRFLRHSAPEY